MLSVHVVGPDIEERHPQLLAGHNIVVICAVFTFAFEIAAAMAERGNQLCLKRCCMVDEWAQIMRHAMLEAVRSGADLPVVWSSKMAACLR